MEKIIIMISRQKKYTEKIIIQSIKVIIVMIKQQIIQKVNNHLQENQIINLKAGHLKKIIMMYNKMKDLS